jgi:hypothetical protein
MPVYEYQGKHYELSDGLTPEQAKFKIQSHLAGEQSSNLGMNALGLAEGVGNFVSGVAASIPQGLRTLGELAVTGDVGTAVERGQSSGDFLTYEPRTEKGKKVAKGISDTMMEAQSAYGDATAREQAYQASLREKEGRLTAGDLNAEQAQRTFAEAAFNLFPLSRIQPGKGKATAKPQAPSKADELIAKKTAPADRPTGDVMGQMANELATDKNMRLGDVPTKTDTGTGVPGAFGQVESLPTRSNPAEVFGRMTEDLQAQSIRDTQYGPLFDQLEQQRLRQEVEALKARQADKQGAAAFDEMAFQVQPKETPVNLPPQADALAWMAKQVEERTGRKATEAELTALWKEQAMAKDRQAAAQQAAEARQAALEAGVAKNVDQNRHGLDIASLDPTALGEKTYNKMNLTSREDMVARQQAVQGQRTMDATTDGFGGLNRDVAAARAAQVGPEARAETIITNQMKEAHNHARAMEHPMVRAAIERAIAAEDIVAKAQLAGEGPARIRRLEKEVADLQALANRVYKNIATKGKVSKSPRGGVGKKQGGAIGFDFGQTKAQRAKQGKNQERGLNIFAGSQAGGGEGFGRRMMTAAKLSERGNTPLQIWNKTGMWFGKDRKWRFEIPDQGAEVRLEGFKSMARGDGGKRLGDVLNHPELFKKYPQLKNYYIRVSKDTDGKAHFSPSSKEIVFNPKYLERELLQAMLEKQEAMKSKEALSSYLMRKLEDEIARGGKYTPDELESVKQQIRDDPGALLGVWERGRDPKGDVYEKFTSTLLHEIQHAVQDIEGFQPGMNWRDADGKIDMSEWKRTHGEIEAEVVAERGHPSAYDKSDLRNLLPMDLTGKHGGDSSWSLGSSVDDILMHNPRGVAGVDNVVGDRKKSPGNKQTGAVFLNPKQHDKLKDVGAIERILGPIAPSKWSPADAVEIAKNAKDVDQNFLQKAANYLTKGGTYQALKTKNPVVRYGVEQISEADRLSRADIRDYVHDKLAPAFRELSNADQRDVWKIINHADKTETAFTRQELLEGGFSEKQIRAIETHREVMDRAFTAMNNVRAKLDMPPVKKREAYAAMNASGDYRMVVKKDGDIVGIIGRNDKYSADILAERLMLEGYEIGDRHYIGGVPHDKGSAQVALLQALDFLAKDDPRLKDLLLKADEVMKDEAYGFLNMDVHTKQKKGVFGMQGRKEDLVVDIKKQQRLNDLNAKEGLQAQVQYAEMALKWEHMTNAAVNIKEVLKSPELVDKQHFAKKWTEEHLQNALGYNPEKVGQYLEKALSSAFELSGVGYSNFRASAAVSRKVVNTALLGLNPYFWGVNVMQPFVAMPGMKAYLVTKGLDVNFDMGTGWSYLGQGGISYMKQRMGKADAFEKSMLEYADKHHVFGSDLVEHSNRVRKDLPYRAEQVGNFVAGGIESSTRHMMFNTFAHMLKDNGMSVKNGLFEAAHNLTDMAMNNYSATERPRMYNAMGPVGDVSANLASFKHNEVSRIALFARQIAEEKSARPLAVALAAQVAFAGIQGIIAFEEADWLYKQITKAMGKPDSLSLAVVRMSEDIGKQVNNMTGGTKGKIGDASYVLSNGGFSPLGVDLSKRLGLGDLVGDDIMSLAFPGGSKLVNMADTAYEAVRRPSEMNTKRAIREWSPAFATGAEDLMWFSKNNGTTAVNRNTLEAVYNRSYQDKVVKATSGTSINESIYKQKHYENKWIQQAYADKRKPVLERAHGELFTQNRIKPETIQEYLKYEGDIKTLEADIRRTLKKQNMTAKDRDYLTSAMSKSITSLRHAQRLQESYKE